MMMMRLLLSFLFVEVLSLILSDPISLKPNSFPCNIPKYPVEIMLNERYTLPETPVIFLYSNGSVTSRISDLVINLNPQFKIHSQPPALFHQSSLSFLKEFHSRTPVILSSSNSYSHGKVSSTLGDYLDNILNIETTNQNSQLLANETYYLFGHNYEGIFKVLSDLYVDPPCHLCDKAGAKTPGIGGKNSGVSFHFHGNGFSEVIHGRKRWFLFPREFTSLTSRIFHSNMTVNSWYESIYPFFVNETFRSAILSSPSPTEETSAFSDLLEIRSDLLILKDHLFECTIQPGEILYFPSFWMHATLNLDDYNFFFSDFLDSQLMKE
jgi:hypothetical protein